MQVTVRCLACLAVLMSIIALTSSAPADVSMKRGDEIIEEQEDVSAMKSVDEIIDEQEVKGNFGRSILNVNFL